MSNIVKQHSTKGKPHSDLYYALIESKEFFKNLKTNNNNKGVLPNRGVATMNPLIISQGSDVQVIELGSDVNQQPKVDYSLVKRLMFVHVQARIVEFKSSNCKIVFCEKPPKKEKGKHTLAEETEFAVISNLRNWGNKLIFNILNMSVFDMARETFKIPLHEIKGLFDVMSLYASLLGEVLEENVWEEVDKGLIFRKMKNSMINIRSNARKAL